MNLPRRAVFQRVSVLRKVRELRVLPQNVGVGATIAPGFLRGLCVSESAHQGNLLIRRAMTNKNHWLILVLTFAIRSGPQG